MTLSVPVKKATKLKIAEVEIDYSQEWQKNHWRSITTSYNRSPFFEYYRDEFNQLLFTEHRYLIDLNQAILTYCLKSLGFATQVIRSEKYRMDVKSTELVDFRGIINAKESYEHRETFVPISYYQVFGKTFVPNLSILDLLFSEGPLSAGIIKRSAKRLNN